MNYSIETIEQALPINLQVQIIDQIQPGQINKFKVRYNFFSHRCSLNCSLK
jgi:hypothetical protein